MNFFEVVSLKILLIDFRIASNLKTGSSKKFSRKILFVDSKISATEMIHLTKNTKKLWF